MSLLISIADCNHGFWKPEEEECKNLSSFYDENIMVQYQNCTQDNIAKKCQGSAIIAVQRLYLNWNLIKQIPTCKVVVRLGVGIDNIEVEGLEKNNIKVLYFPGFCTQEVANHALSLILCCYRNLIEIYDYQKRLNKQTWGKPKFVSSIKSAFNTNVGILGLGRIGREVAKRLKVCGFRVLAHDPYVEREEFGKLGIESISLKKLFSLSDIVTIHCSLTKETKGMINTSLIQLMPEGSCIVNTARGQILVTSDLKEMLRTHRLAKAYVDVYDPEPPFNADLNVKNLYITPHIAFYSFESLDHLKRQFIRQAVKTYYEM